MTANDPGHISDGYHTFNELYMHRHMLFLSLLKLQPSQGWISQQHHDGEMWDGMFIAGVSLSTGDITYHLPLSLWELACKTGVTVLERGKEWDGHTSDDVVNRLRDWVGQSDDN